MTDNRATLEGEFLANEPDDQPDYPVNVDALRASGRQGDMFGNALMPAEDPHTSLVFKRNEVIHGQFSMKTLSMKVFSAILSKHDPRSTEFHPVNVSRAELARMVNVSRQTMYEMADDVTNDLKHVVLRLPYIDKHWEETVRAEKIEALREGREPRKIPRPDANDRESFAKEHLFDLATYNANAGILTFKFNERLKDYLIDLRGNFTYYQLKSIISMSSGHAIRIYELLRSALSLKSVQSGVRTAFKTIRYDELRKMLEIAPESYPKFAHFERAVLRKAQKQMEGGDLEFTYTLPERIRGNRQTPVETICFQVTAVSTQESSGDWKLLFTQIFTENARRKLLLEYSEQRIERNIEYYVAQIEDGTNIAKPSSWVRKAIKEDFAGLELIKTGKHVTEAMQTDFIKHQLEKTWLGLPDIVKDEFLEKGFNDTGVELMYEAYRLVNSRGQVSTKFDEEL